MRHCYSGFAMTMFLVVAGCKSAEPPKAERRFDNYSPPLTSILPEQDNATQRDRERTDEIRSQVAQQYGR